jgi:hypothetical protein
VASELPIEGIRLLVRALETEGVSPWAFTGGVAFSVHVEPRYTRDLDLQAVVPLGAVDRLLALYDGARSGPAELPDVLRLAIAGFDVDIFVAHTAYARLSLSRAQEVVVDDLRFRVVTPEDLLLHKLIELKSDRRRILQDLADIRALAEAYPALDRQYLAQWGGDEVLRLLDGLAALDEKGLLEFLTRPSK